MSWYMTCIMVFLLLYICERKNILLSNVLVLVQVTDISYTFLFQVTPNLYGNLIANTAAGIAGGTGVMPGGLSISVFIKS